MLLLKWVLLLFSTCIFLIYLRIQIIELQSFCNNNQKKIILYVIDFVGNFYRYLQLSSIFHCLSLSALFSFVNVLAVLFLNGIILYIFSFFFSCLFFLEALLSPHSQSTVCLFYFFFFQVYLLQHPNLFHVSCTKIHDKS